MRELILILILHTIDYDGSHCYLFESADKRTRMHVSYTGEDLGIAEGAVIKLTGKVVCEKVIELADKLIAIEEHVDGNYIVRWDDYTQLGYAINQYRGET